METKQYYEAPFELKRTDQGIITGYASTWSLDLGGDKIDKKAFDEWIKSHASNGLPMLWSHSSSEVIGKFTLFTTDEKGLFVEGEIYQDVTRGRDAIALLKHEAIQSMSIGYIAKDFSFEDDIRILKEIHLFETSLVLNPMNPEASITSIKSEDGEVDLKALEKTLRTAGLSRKQSKEVVHEVKNYWINNEEQSNPYDQDELKQLLTAIQK